MSVNIKTSTGLTPVATSPNVLTYELLKNATGEIVLKDSNGVVTSVTDSNTTYGFTQEGTTLTITPSVGDPITIQLGGAPTYDEVITALGFTPAKEADMTGATESAAGTHGLVPAPEVGANLKFLRGDGTWQEVKATSEVISATEPTDQQENEYWVLEY